MRLARAMLVPMLVAGCGATPQLETRTFEISYLDPVRLESLVAPYVYRDRDGAAGAFSVAGNLLSVRETRDNLDRITRVLAEYDRMRPPVRLRFQVILADGAETTDPAIAEVETALRSLFRFQGYRLAAEAVVGGLEGSNVSQVVNGDGGPYSIETEIRELRGSGDSTFVRLRVRFNIPMAGSSLETVVAVRAGQTVVLGNVGGPSRKGTVILTVRPDLPAE